MRTGSRYLAHRQLRALVPAYLRVGYRWYIRAQNTFTGEYKHFSDSVASVVVINTTATHGHGITFWPIEIAKVLGQPRIATLAPLCSSTRQSRDPPKLYVENGAF
jgi:hypothetical protein